MATSQLKSMRVQIQREREAWAVVRQQTARTIRGLEDRVESETTTRLAAQRGLVPYVYAIQGLNEWLRDERPELGAELEPIMRRLGIWGVKVGYDPDKGTALSVLGKLERARRKAAALTPSASK